MKKSSLLLAVLLCAGTAFAQISTGEPHSSVIPRTGNRPKAGDFGLYVGGSVRQIIDLVELNKKDGFQNMKWWALPAINFKYYITDNWEARLGFQFACKGSVETARLKDVSGTFESARDVHYTRFLPGVAYHFNTKNIVDVYVGAQMPIGFNIDNTRSKQGKDYKQTIMENSFVIGGGVYVGLQFFIADLPLALGIETGYSGIATIGTGKQTKTTTNGETVKTMTWNDGTQLNNIKSGAYMEGTWGADAAITLTYFFQR